MSVPAPPAPPVPTMPQPAPQAQPILHPEEIPALGKVVWFTVVQLVGIVTGWVLGFFVFGTMFANPASLNLGPNPTPAQVRDALGPVFQGLAATVPFDILIQVVALGILTLAFRQLRKIDSARFSAPSTFMILMIVGVALVSIGVIPLVYSIPNIIAQAPATGGPPSAAFMSAIASVLAEVAFIAIGGLLAIIGIVGGQILGLWRLGSRYNETLIKVGAIFTIIPFLNVVAPILVLVGAYQVRGRLQTSRMGISP